MIKENYLVRVRDTSNGEEVIEYSVGPRGKTEVGAGGARGLVRKVYEGSDLGEELERKLERSLGAADPEKKTTTSNNNNGNAAGGEDGEQTQAEAQQIEQPSRTSTRRRTRRHAATDDDDD